MGAFPSGQRGQTVNLLSLTSVVRIHPLPPTKKVLRKKYLFCWWDRMAREARTRGSLQLIPCTCLISLAKQTACGLFCGHESTRFHQTLCLVFLLVGGDAERPRTRGSLSPIPCICLISLAKQTACGLFCGHESTRGIRPGLVTCLLKANP